MENATGLLQCVFSFQNIIYLYIWVLTSLLTLHTSYYDGYFYGQRKPGNTVGEDSVL